MTTNRLTLNGYGEGGIGQRLALLDLAATLRCVWDRLRHDQQDDLWVARDAEIAADQTCRRILGDDAAGLAVWHGSTDGSAVGTLDGLQVSWVPEVHGPERLCVHRCCTRCDAAWSTVVVSLGQLVAGLVDDRCGCGCAR